MAGLLHCITNASYCAMGFRLYQDIDMNITYTWRGAEIQEDLALLEEAIFLVQLDQLEGGTGAVSLFLCELIPLVETALSVLLLDRHGGQSGVVRLHWILSGDGGGGRGAEMHRTRDEAESKAQCNADCQEIENFFFFPTTALISYRGLLGVGWG